LGTTLGFLFSLFLVLAAIPDGAPFTGLIGFTGQHESSPHPTWARWCQGGSETIQRSIREIKTEHYMWIEWRTNLRLTITLVGSLARGQVGGDLHQGEAVSTIGELLIDAPCTGAEEGLPLMWILHRMSFFFATNGYCICTIWRIFYYNHYVDLYHIKISFFYNRFTVLHHMFYVDFFSTTGSNGFAKVVMFLLHLFYAFATVVQNWFSDVSG
jgi:hypothetical protein